VIWLNLAVKLFHFLELFTDICTIFQFYQEMECFA